MTSSIHWSASEWTEGEVEAGALAEGESEPKVEQEKDAET